MNAPLGHRNRTLWSSLPGAAFWLTMGLFAALSGLLAHLSWRWTVETLAFLAVMATLSRTPPISSTIHGGTPIHAFLLALFLGAAVAAQVGKTSRGSFPFITWRMFPGGEAGRAPSYLALEGIQADGSRIIVRGESLYPSLRYHRFQTTLRKWDARARSSAGSRAVFQDLLDAIRDRHNQRHPESPVISVEVRSISVPLR